MKTNLNLSVPKPCSEKWENFTSTSTGGFCSSCSKVVIDFTHTSNAEILQYLRNKPTHSCGRFRADQLKVYVPESPVKIIPRWTLFKAGAISLLLLLLSKPSVAQSSIKSKTESVQESTPTNQASKAKEELFTVKGVVKSKEDGSELPGVNIVLEGSTVGTTSDGYGRFEFPQQLKEGDVLIFSFIGLTTRTYNVGKKSNNDPVVNLKIEIEMDLSMDIMGELAIDEVYQEKKQTSLWSKLKSLF